MHLFLLFPPFVLGFVWAPPSQLALWYVFTPGSLWFAGLANHSKSLIVGWLLTMLLQYSFLLLAVWLATVALQFEVCFAAKPPDASPLAAPPLGSSNSESSFTGFLPPAKANLVPLSYCGFAWVLHLLGDWRRFLAFFLSFLSFSAFSPGTSPSGWFT